MEDRRMLRRRTWRWLRGRILALLTIPPVYVPAGDHLEPVPQTRIGYALNPPGKE